MKIHLAWIRMTAAAALAVGVGVHPAAAQYAPYRPAPPQPVAPQAAPAPANPYVAYRAPVAQQPVFPQGTAPRYQAPAVTYQQQAPVYQQPSPAYQQPAAAYRPQPVAYPQTAMAHYPATYGGTPYVAQQPTEALPSPQQPTQTTAPVAETTMPAEGVPTAAPAAGGYPAAGCNCGGGGYTAGSYYGGGAAGCGCNTGYPDLSSYMGGDCGNDNIWFGGVYYLYMDRDRPSEERLAVEIEPGTVPYPYYPPASTTIISTANVNDDFRSGVEVRFGCTFSVGDACSTGCGCGSGYPYAGGAGCGCGGCNTCSVPTTYGWEFVWWGLDGDANEYVREDTINTRIYGTKSFAGIEYDRDGSGGAYAYRPLNDYYDYQMPINTPPGSPPNGYTSVLAQRVYNNFRAQNFEVNILRFPMCDTCGNGGYAGAGGCGGGSCGCGGDACGCGATSCGGCDDSWNTHFSMYGACGVRYFRIDDDFAYDVEFTEWVGGAPQQGGLYNGFTYDNSNEICYDINVDNNLIGPQLGWTTNYCIGCRWNLFCNSTFGIFDNHITQRQRIWTGGDGAIRFANSTNNVNVSSSKDDVAFLGELRVGGSYDMTCHWRAVLAYRAVALTGIATSTGQIPDNFSDESDLARINSDNSMIIHGVQIGTECRY